MDSRKYQEIFTEQKEIKVNDKKTISIEILYRTSDNNYNLEGLVLNIHYDSAKLSLLNIKDNCPSMFSCNTFKNIISDPDDKNYKIVKIAWGDIFTKWPGKKLPAHIATLTFNIENLGETIIKFSDQETAPGYKFKKNNLKILS